MASSWTCSDSHTHELNRTVRSIDSLSAGGNGVECLTSGDRITGVDYPVTVKREWTASSRTEAAAS